MGSRGAEVLASLTLLAERARGGGLDEGAFVEHVLARNGMLLFPAFRIQTKLRRGMLGERYWRRMARAAEREEKEREGREEGGEKGGPSGGGGGTGRRGPSSRGRARPSRGRRRGCGGCGCGCGCSAERGRRTGTWTHGPGTRPAERGGAERWWQPCRDWGKEEELKKDVFLVYSSIVQNRRSAPLLGAGSRQRVRVRVRSGRSPDWPSGSPRACS